MLLNTLHFPPPGFFGDSLPPLAGHVLPPLQGATDFVLVGIVSVVQQLLLTSQAGLISGTSVMVHDVILGSKEG